MEKRKLGKSGLEFAPIAFGGNVFGWTADEATSHKLLDAFVDAGFPFVDTASRYSHGATRPKLPHLFGGAVLPFVDTAAVYSRWAPGHKGGESEVVIGSWLKKDPNKSDKGLSATKGGMGDP